MDDFKNNYERIFLAGDVSGPCGILESWKRILTNMGGKTKVFKLNKYSKLKKWGYRLEKIPPFKFLKKIGKNWVDSQIERMNKNFVDEAIKFNADLLFVIQGSQVIEGSIKKIKKELDIDAINWLIDDPVTVSDAGALMSLPEYSAVFCADKSWIPVVSIFNKNSYYLMSATDPSLYHPIGDIKEKDIDILFVGAFFSRNANTVLRSYFIKKMAEKGYKISIYGPGSSNVGYGDILNDFDNVNVEDRSVGHEELNVLYNRSKIVFNINNPMFKYSPADRIMNAASAGALQITDYKNDILDIFDDSGVVLFKDEKDLIYKVDYYLKNVEEGIREGIKASEIIRKKHTHKHRIEEILKVLKTI